MQEANLAGLSSRVALVVGASAAMAAPDDTALELFDLALALPGIKRWQFDLARVRLAYGERLRRSRAMTEARVQLEAAREIFERLRARDCQPRGTVLTNKQIAKRLFLSPRTVGGHRHRAFPKPGVGTRAALRDALQSLPRERPRACSSFPGQRRSCANSLRISLSHNTELAMTRQRSQSAARCPTFPNAC